jgi:hypothetical protein
VTEVRKAGIDDVEVESSRLDSTHRGTVWHAKQTEQLVGVMALAMDDGGEKVEESVGDGGGEKRGSMSTDCDEPDEAGVVGAITLPAQSAWLTTAHRPD